MSSKTKDICVDNGVVHKLGEAWTDPDVCNLKTCRRGGYIDHKGCPQVIVPNGCTYIQGDLAQQFPFCCPRFECPDDDSSSSSSSSSSSDDEPDKYEDLEEDGEDDGAEFGFAGLESFNQVPNKTNSGCSNSNNEGQENNDSNKSLGEMIRRANRYIDNLKNNGYDYYDIRIVSNENQKHDSINPDKTVHLTSTGEYNSVTERQTQINDAERSLNEIRTGPVEIKEAMERIEIARPMIESAAQEGKVVCTEGFDEYLKLVENEWETAQEFEKELEPDNKFEEVYKELDEKRGLMSYMGGDKPPDAAEREEELLFPKECRDQVGGGFTDNDLKLGELLGHDMAHLKVVEQLDSQRGIINASLGETPKQLPQDLEYEEFVRNNAGSIERLTQTSYEVQETAETLHKSENVEMLEKPPDAENVVDTTHDAEEFQHKSEERNEEYHTIEPPEQSTPNNEDTTINNNFTTETVEATENVEEVTHDTSHLQEETVNTLESFSPPEMNVEEVTHDTSYLQEETVNTLETFSTLENTQELVTHNVDDPDENTQTHEDQQGIGEDPFPVQGTEELPQNGLEEFKHSLDESEGMTQGSFDTNELSTSLVGSEVLDNIYPEVFEDVLTTNHTTEEDNIADEPSGEFNSLEPLTNNEEVDEPS